MNNASTRHTDSSLLVILSDLLLVATLVACGALVYWLCIVK